MRLLLSVVLLGLAFINPAFAEDADYTIIIKDHKFSPEELKVPAGQKVKVTIDNQDATPEEFESHDLKREKIVKGNNKIVVAVGPLKAGTYKYVGEFNEATAKGVIVAE
jgi:plastocyanin